MIVVVDGYNLLKHVFHKIKGKLDKQRSQLIKELGFYKKKKSGIGEIVLVFDGGREARATREIRSGITVVFSGQHESADDWIIDYVARHEGKEIILVTRDRELRERCRSERVEPLNVVDFYEIVQAELFEEVGAAMERQRADDIKKYTDGENEALDILMEQADVYEKREERPVVAKKKGRSRTPSKTEKKLLEKLKKL